MNDLPGGTVTFFLTGIDAEQEAWDADPGRMQAAVERHDALAADLIPRHSGFLIKRRGEDYGLFAVFAGASDAVAAACDFQSALQHDRESYPFNIRIALNSGEAQIRDGDYFGRAVNLAARLRSLAYGGQILLTQATQELVCSSPPNNNVILAPLGAHSLRDFSRPEQIFQVLHPDLPAGFPPLKSLNLVPNNLPHSFSSFVGRERETYEIKGLLESSRLLTLTGSAGCGKTRLAMQVASECLDRFPDGVWAVELAGVSEPYLLAYMVASAAGVREDSKTSIIETLCEQLRPRRMLLVLDNCEHLVSDCAQLATDLLRACAGLRILATSREILDILGETSWRVPSLSVPEASATSIEMIGSYEAVSLFVERAGCASPSFKFTTANAATIAQICRRLDGIPLAVELAAARVNDLNVEQIAQRLGDRFKLLTGGSHTVLPRHQTISAAVDWSYELLSESERTLFKHLAVFSGGFTLELAESLCSSERDVTRSECKEGAVAPSRPGSSKAILPGDVLDLLSQLVDKSLIVPEEHNEETRYRYLETIRQYGVEKLRDSGEARSVRNRHVETMLALAEKAEPGLIGSGQQHWLNRLETEHDNLRSALEWGRASDRTDYILRFIASIWRFWMVRGHLTEARGWIDEALPVRKGHCQIARALLGRALNGAGSIAWRQGDTGTARAFYAQSLAIRREQGDAQGIANSLNNLGLIARGENDLPSARQYFEEGLAIQRELGHSWGIALALSNIASAAIDQGDLSTARIYLDESQPLWIELGDNWGLGACLNSKGNLARIAGDFQAAEGFFQRALAIQRSISDNTDVLESLTSLALVAAERKQYDKALCLFAAARAARDSVGVPGQDSDYRREKEAVKRIRKTMGAKAFAKRWNAGKRMRIDQAIAYAQR